MNASLTINYHRRQPQLQIIHFDDDSKKKRSANFETAILDPVSNASAKFIGETLPNAQLKLIYGERQTGNNFFRGVKEFFRGTLENFGFFRNSAEVGMYEVQKYQELIPKEQFMNKIREIIIDECSSSEHRITTEEADKWFDGFPQTLRNKFINEAFLELLPSLGLPPEKESRIRNLVESQELAYKKLQEIHSDLGIDKTVKKPKLDDNGNQIKDAEGNPMTEGVTERNLLRFITSGRKVNKKVKEVAANNPELETLINAYRSQEMAGAQQIWDFGIAPMMLGPLFVKLSQFLSSIGQGLLGKVALSAAMGFFYTQSIAIGKSVLNMEYSNLGKTFSKFIPILMVLTWFSHIFASLTRMGGVFFDVSPEEEAKPNFFTPIKKFIYNFFFKPVDILARLVNSSSFALFFAHDRSQWNALRNNNKVDKDTWSYKTQAGLYATKTYLNGFAAAGSTVSNILGVIFEHKQEALYKKFEPLLKILHGEQVQPTDIMSSNLPPEAKAMGLRFIKEKEIIMKKVLAFRDKLVKRVKSGKLSEAKAQKLWEKKQQVFGEQLEGLQKQLVSYLEAQFKGISKASWWADAIGTISFMGILPTMLCRGSIGAMGLAASELDSKQIPIKGNVGKLFGEFINQIKSGKAARFVDMMGGQGALGGGKFAKAFTHFGTVATMLEIPFCLLMVGASILKLISQENSPLYSEDFKKFVEEHKGVMNGLELASNVAMIV